MSTTAVAEVSKGKQAGAGGSLAERDFTADQVDLIRRQVCPGASNDELALFLHLCRRTGLDPLARQIYAIRRKENLEGEWVEKMTFQTGIDGYRLIADRTGRYVPGREPTFSYDKGGNLHSATAYVKKQTLDGAWHDVSATAHYGEYVALKRDKTPTRLWATKPHVMLAKCAEALALRRAFPAELSGVYTSEEMPAEESPGRQVSGPAARPAAREPGEDDPEPALPKPGAEFVAWLDRAEADAVRAGLCTPGGLKGALVEDARRKSPKASADPAAWKEYGVSWAVARVDELLRQYKALRGENGNGNGGES